MRICVDLDGTICDLRREGQTYADVLPKPGAKERMEAMRAAGHTIIIHTARNMGSQGHNVGKVMRNVGKMTLDWLERYEIPYDEIFFGKPNAHLTIDDRAVQFRDWSLITDELIEREARNE
jgi:capsule biosynthesis phosphatase